MLHDPGRYQSCGEIQVPFISVNTSSCQLPPVNDVCILTQCRHPPSCSYIDHAIHIRPPSCSYIDHAIHIRPIILTSSTWSPRFEKSSMTGFGHALSSSQVTEQRLVHQAKSQNSSVARSQNSAVRSGWKAICHKRPLLSLSIRAYRFLIKMSIYWQYVSQNSALFIISQVTEQQCDQVTEQCRLQCLKSHLP